MSESVWVAVGRERRESSRSWRVRVATSVEAKRGDARGRRETGGLERARDESNETSEIDGEVGLDGLLMAMAMTASSLERERWTPRLGGVEGRGAVA